MSDTGVQIVFCTFPDIELARQIGTMLIGRQLAKCVNLIPSVESIYEWEGKIEKGSEVLAIFKVVGEAYPAFESALVEQHPYEVPEVLAVDAVSGYSAYVSWLSGAP